MQQKEKIMKNKFKKAYTELKELKAPVMLGGWNGENTFRISGEDNCETCWADYYQEYTPSRWDFGINPIITRVLEKYGLYAEWQNAGVLNVYED